MGHEMPLGTINLFAEKLAAGQPNEGFYVDDGETLLVIVIITDEDEDSLSTATPAGTKAVLDSLTGGDDKYVVVTIAGIDACESDFGSAIEAVVLKDFTYSVPNGVMGDICLGDLTPSLEEALSVMTVVCDEFPPPV